MEIMQTLSDNPEAPSLNLLSAASEVCHDDLFDIIQLPSQLIIPAATQLFPSLPHPIPTNIIEHMDNQK